MEVQKMVEGDGRSGIRCSLEKWKLQYYLLVQQTYSAIGRNEGLLAPSAHTDHEGSSVLDRATAENTT